MRLRSKWIFASFIALVVIGAIFAVGVAHAQLPSTQNLRDAAAGLDDLLTIVRDSAYSWSAELYGLARTLFWLLAGIQFVWTFFPLVFRQADFGELMSELLRFVLMIGFFLFLLNYSNAIAARIVQSFQDAGNIALGTPGIGISPADVFGRAIYVADMISKSGETGVTTSGSPVQGMLPLAGLTIMGSFVFIAAFMVLTLVESWIVINASVLLMGMGGSQWTREYVISVLKYTVSVGAKMFILTLIVGMVMESVERWIDYIKDPQNITAAEVWTLAGLGIVCSYLAKAIPEMVQGLIMGTSLGFGMNSTMGAMSGMAATNSMRADAAASPGSPLAGANLAAVPSMGGTGGGGIGSAGSGANIFNAQEKLLGAMGAAFENHPSAQILSNQIGGGINTGPSGKDKDENRRKEKDDLPKDGQDTTTSSSNGASTPAAPSHTNTGAPGGSVINQHPAQSLGDTQPQGSSESSQSGSGSNTSHQEAKLANSSSETTSSQGGGASQGNTLTPNASSSTLPGNSPEVRSLETVSKQLGTDGNTVSQSAAKPTTRQPQSNQTQAPSARQTPTINPVVNRGSRP